MIDHTKGIPAPLFRLPAESTIGRVKLQVADLDRSVRYYTNVLGLNVLHATKRQVVLGPQESQTVLVELVEQSGATPVPRTGRLGLYHFALLLPNRETLGAFIAHLAQLNIRAGMADHAVSEAVYLTDPDGLGIEVYTDRPQSEWRYEGNQLYMTTERLDAANLVAAAQNAGVSWTGMPAETVMGHIHLHVGDLDRADALYHTQLGFDRTVWGYPGALFMSAGGYHHHLAVNTWAAGTPMAMSRDARLLEWEIVVPDITVVDTIVATMNNATTPVIPEANSAIITDPWGTNVRISKKR